MVAYENSVVCGLTEIRKVEIRPERVAAWTLIFTNAFFIFYFFAKLIEWV
jgi:hypothetical protein